MITGSCFYNYSRDDYYGGAIYSRYSRITIIKSNFSDNKQTLNVQDHSLIISECTFINNTPGYSGRPAVYISGGQSVIISEATFINNTLEYNGGALYVSGSGGSLLVNESIFINNTADKRDGGALYLAGKFSNATITKSTFIYNSANHSNCGVIYSTTHVHLMDSIFYYNRANGDGGAACIRNATLQMHICSKSCCWKWWVIPFRQQRCRHQFYFVLK